MPEALNIDFKQKYVRSYKVDSRKIDVEKRTVEIAFSSEEPVLRYFGYEVLDHSPKSVRLERLNSNANVLVNHDFDDVVAVVELARIDSDRKGRAVVRFGKSAYADEIFQDVVDGIRTNVSVGYSILGGVLEDSLLDGQKVVRVTDWEPYEISIVSVPADIKVGVGRSKDEEPEAKTVQQTNNRVKQMTEENKNTAAEGQPGTQAAPKIDTAAIEQSAMQRALQRVQDINKIADLFKGNDEVRTLAQESINTGKTVAEFQQAVLTRVSSAGQAVKTPEIGLSEKEKNGFKVTRLLLSQLYPNDREIQKAAGLEIEASRAAAKLYEGQGITSRGLIIPHDILMDQRFLKSNARRDLSVGTASAGGYTVGTELLGASFIEILRNRTIVDRLGATTLTGLVGNISIPRQTGAATAYAVAEAAAASESQQAFDQVTFAPKTVSANTTYSRQLMMQGSIDVENFVRMDLAKVIALKIDYLALYGSGSSNEPQGLKNITGINTKDFAANAPTFAEIVDLETLIAADNADIGTLAYAINATGRGSLKTTEKFSSTGMTIWEPGNTVNGYRAEVSNQIASNDFWFGNWADLVIAMWGGLDLLVNPFSEDKEGNVRITVHQSMDINARHPESFARGNNTL